MHVDGIAKVCHEVNKVLCEAAGDMSQKGWNDADEWQRESVRNGVVFAKKNLSASPSDQHDAWSAEKRAAGWVYGKTKDAVAKTHPCLIEYDALPFEQRVKDHVFRAIVKALS